MPGLNYRARVPLSQSSTVDSAARRKLAGLNACMYPCFRIQSRDYLGGEWTGGTVSRTKADNCKTVYKISYDDGESSVYDGKQGEPRNLENEFDLGFFRLEQWSSNDQ
jgi:hypothetical protein